MPTSRLDSIDAVFRLVDREVWIVTAADGSRRGGLTATWVSQASIDGQRPVVLAALAVNHFTAELVDASGALACHLIAAGQFEQAWNFARDSGRDRDKLAGLATRRGQTGSPILEDCLAWLECRVFARLTAGDRNYYWADVLDGGVRGAERPLCESELFARLSDEQRGQLIAGRDADIELHRPLYEGWLSELPEILRGP